MNQQLTGNLHKYLALNILRGAAVSTSIVLWVVFLQKQYGFTLTEVTLLDLPFWIGKFLFEIPTGVVADRYGRRISLAISSGMSSLAWLVFALSGNFWVLAATQVFGAIGATFSSGADEALLYETMQAAGREDEYARMSARMGAAQTTSAMVCGVGVGFLATRSMLLPVFLSAGLFALSIIPILLMKETADLAQARAGDGRQPPHASYIHIVREAAGALRGSSVLRWAAAYMLILSCVAFYVSIFLQPFTLSLGLPIAALGPIMVAMQLMSIAGSLSVQRAEKLFGMRALLFGVPLLLIACLLAAGILRTSPMLAVLALSSFLFSLTQPVLLAVIQGKVSNTARATLLSIQSLLTMVFLTFTEPSLGLVADRFGVHAAFLASAGLLALFIFPLLWKRQAALEGSRLAE